MNYFKYLRRNELQTTTLSVLLLLQQSPHFWVVLSQTLLSGPGAIVIRRTGGCMRLLEAYTETNRGPLAQGLGAGEEFMYEWMTEVTLMKNAQIKMCQLYRHFLKPDN